MTSSRLRLALASFSLLAAVATGAAAQELPPGFVLEQIGATFAEPVALAYIDEQRLLVAERAGRVWFVDHDVKRNVVYDIRDDTQANGGRGLLGIAVAPDFDLTGWIYLLHSVQVPGVAARESSFARVVRVHAEHDAGGDLIALPSTQEVLLGESWTSGIPSCESGHAVGNLRFLSDGSLVLTTGDSAAFDVTDTGGLHPSCFESGRTSADQDLGAYRAQYEDSLSGKVLRIDPETGRGLPDNPFYTGDPDDLRSRVYARGLRNPFRFTLVPGSGPREALFIGDVGWNNWEEINLCLGGENFGWPCFEGPNPETNYQTADTRGICASASPAAPVQAWHHWQVEQAGFRGVCASGLCVYSGERYPEVYRGRLFFTDYDRGWLRAAEIDEELRIHSSLLFGTNVGHPVDLVSQPGTGDLVYISLPRVIYRIRYVGNQFPPVAVASATPSSGAGALDVTLSAEGSHDPDGQPLVYSWDLGDGANADGPVVVHHYPLGAVFDARLTVTDVEGLTDSAEVRITPGNTPPRIVTLVTPQDGGTYVPDEPLRLAGLAEDAEDGIPAESSWTLDLVHDHHVHSGHATVEGLNAIVVPDSHGPGDNHFIVRLEVTDASGLRDERALEIHDAHSLPQAHLVELETSNVRVGQTLAPIGHVDFSLGRVSEKQPSLTWDWGDGAVDVFPVARHHVDTRPTHVYHHPGTYKLRLLAELDARPASVQTVLIRVAEPRPAVAIFAPLEAGRWVPRAEQEGIVTALESALARHASEVRAFHLGQGATLAAWMESLASDALSDVVVLIDYLPSALVAQGVSGSLLERWVAHGNGVVWTGITPFQNLLYDDGTTAFAVAGAELFFGATVSSVVDGVGVQFPTTLGQRVVPALTPIYLAERALHYDQLGPAWRVARVFATDSDQDSDAVELEHIARGGFYAQFLCIDAAIPSRAAVLSQYLLDKLGKARLRTR